MAGLWGRRRVRAREKAAPASPPPAAARLVRDQTAGWAHAQITPWAARTHLSMGDYVDGLRHLNEVKHDVFVFDIAGDDVHVREKHVHHPLPFNRRIEHFRVHLYRDHLRAAAARAQLSRPLSLGVVVGDLVRDVDPLLPIFAYQKAVGEPWILIPDVEMLEVDFYEIEGPDTTSDKVDTVVFSGSSTGAALDIDAVHRNGSERLHYAARFLDDPAVQFTIGRASECASPEAEATLRAKPYFRHVSWEEQLKHRYILSLDGNGATCSRVIRTLRSRSCLVKQRSENILFYFPGLLPWHHYVPVEDAEDLARLAPLLTRADFPSAGLCDAANAFCTEQLNRRAVVDYTAALLRDFDAEYLRRI